MGQDERVRLQIEIDRSLRDEIDVMLRKECGSSSRGLSMVVRTALVEHLRAKGYLKPKVVQAPD